MFKINTYLSNCKEVVYENKGVTIEIGTIDSSDSKSQVNFILGILNDLDTLTNSQAAEALRDELCEKYNLSKND